MKIKIIISFFIIIITSCSSDKTFVKEENSSIIGRWLCVFLGNTVRQLGLSKPIFYEFNPNNEFNCLITISGVSKTYSGKYFIDKSKNPKIINIIRSDNREFHGIIKFENNKKFIMVLYDKRILPIAENFGDDDIQIFIKQD